MVGGMYRKFEEGLDNKVKLATYKTFIKNVEFKKVLAWSE